MCNSTPVAAAAVPFCAAQLRQLEGPLRPPEQTAGMANQHVYSYVQLAEAAEAPWRRHNLWAVVAECSVPRPTKGTGGRGRHASSCCSLFVVPRCS